MFEISPNFYKKLHLWRVVKKAKKSFDYYKKIKSFEDFEIINKKKYLENFKEMNQLGLSYDACLNQALSQEESRNFTPLDKELVVGLSSGTSGQRGVFIASANEQMLWVANIFSHLPWFSLFRKSKIAFFLRANSPVYENVSRSKRIQFEYFDLTIKFDDLLEKLKKFEPTVLVAPPYILNMILDDIETRKSKFSNLEVIVSVADTISGDLKGRLRKEFKCPVHEIYQATEGFLAATCRYENLHLNDDVLLFEEKIIDEKTNRWTPIITDYYRQSQAVIRFELNDTLVSSNKECPCGSKRKHILKVEGRNDETLLIQGQRFFPDYLRHAVQNSLRHSIDFCIVHQAENEVMVKFEGEKDLALVNEVANNLEKLFHSKEVFGVNIKFEFGFQRELWQKRKRVFGLEVENA